LTAAEKLTSDDVRAARDIAASARAQCLAACETVDVIIMPTLPILPPRCDAHRATLAGRDVPVVVALVAETCLANVAGVPALSMPCPNPHGAFVSLQLLAPQGHDTRLIAIAHRLALLLAAN
jgi:aspartyl-tRNA(Asn)/glutamyl-tRNA(Gln) amidotransferase subunit A